VCLPVLPPRRKDAPSGAFAICLSGGFAEAAILQGLVDEDDINNGNPAEVFWYTGARGQTGQQVRMSDCTSWVSAAAGNLLGVLDWFCIYRLAGRARCIGWRPLGTAQPSLTQPCLACHPSYTLSCWLSPGLSALQGSADAVTCTACPVERLCMASSSQRHEFLVGAASTLSAGEGWFSARTWQSRGCELIHDFAKSWLRTNTPPQQVQQAVLPGYL